MTRERRRRVRQRLAIATDPQLPSEIRERAWQRAVELREGES